MAIVFTKLSDSLLADPKQAMRYVEAKLRQLAFLVVPESVEALSQSIRNTADGTVNLAIGNKLPHLPLASKETCAKERSLSDEAVQNQFESKTACLLKAIEIAKKKSDLKVHEIVEEERFTYLEMPFKNLPKYTGVLVCRTDQAEYSLITVGYLFRPYQARRELKCHEVIYYQAPEIQVTGAVGDIAKSLATGLLSGIGGKIGVLIFNAIFPPGVPSYFNEVYKQIEKIVNKELTQNTIDEINGQINGMKDWVAITYTNAKESGLSKDKLTNILQPREPQIAIQLVGVLMEQRYAQPGITVFMIGAGMHLSVLQELALIDPDAASPIESHYAKSVQQYAKEYAGHAKPTTENILRTRADTIHKKFKSFIPPGTTVPMFENLYWFEDSLTGYKSQIWMNVVDTKGESNPDAEKQRDEAFANYTKEKHDQIVKDMEDPVATANEWLKLVDRPIPPIWSLCLVTVKCQHKQTGKRLNDFI